jgi:hypothetical protein
MRWPGRALVGSATALVLALVISTAGAAGRVHWLGPTSHLAAVEAWLYLDHALSVDCSPPRACYAKTQWIHAYVNCYSRTAAILQVISMDLNGDVIAHAKAEVPGFVRGYGYRLADPAPGPAGDAVQLVCGPYPERD